MEVIVGLDDGNLRDYRNLPLLTEKRGPKLDNALYIYGVAFYLGKNKRPHGLAFIDLNPKKRGKHTKQIYRSDVASKILDKIDSINPQEVWACNYFSPKGPRYYDHPEKKYLLQDLEQRMIPVKFGKSGFVQKAHGYVTEFIKEIGQFIDFKLEKLEGWSTADVETVGSAEEFLSWNNMPVENGVSGRIIITKQLQDYIGNLYDIPVEPYQHIKIDYKSFTRTKPT